jgi:L,D-peptidoglycan transpeptidase YkuD (ErfK/YbiS/YcfS/YnhG family)
MHSIARYGVIAVLGLLLACKAAPKPQPGGPLVRSRQRVVVRTAQWGAAEGTLQRFDRNSARDGWHAVSAPSRVTVGNGGLAWGRGLHPAQSGPQKREGDGKAPAGVYKLPSTFGYALEAPGNLPYTMATPELLCIDDPASVRYNRILRRSEIQFPDWKSFESMRRDDDQYRLGVLVEHNPDPVKPDAGSCIFLHVWKSPGEPTDGCTAMASASIETLVAWLDWASEPTLVQLPDSEYQRLRDAWKLP